MTGQPTARIALHLLVIPCLIAVPLAAQSLNEIFAGMDKTAQQFKSAEANIKRDRHTAVIDDDSYDTGTIKIKKDKGHDIRMLIDVTGADAQTVSLAGSTASVYYPKINTVQVYDIGAKKNLVEQFLLLGFGASSAELKAAYTVTWVGMESIGGQPSGHIVLVPRSGDVSRQLKQAELWISQNHGLPVQQKIVFANGDFWLVTYSNLKFNPDLSDDSLKLKTKKGVLIEHPRL